LLHSREDADVHRLSKRFLVSIPVVVYWASGALRAVDAQVAQKEVAFEVASVKEITARDGAQTFSITPRR
jgi:hypothetical protein